MVKTTLLIGLEDEAALLRDECLVGHVGYPGHVTQTAAIVTRTSSHSQVEICKSQSQHVSCKMSRGSMWGWETDLTARRETHCPSSSAGWPSSRCLSPPSCCSLCHCLERADTVSTTLLVTSSKLRLREESINSNLSLNFYSSLLLREGSEYLQIVI